MVIPHIVVLVAASLAVLALPCAVAVAVRADRSVLRRAWQERARRDRPALRGLDRSLRGGAPSRLEGGSAGSGSGVASAPGGGVGSGSGADPSLWQVEAELRRLSAQRRGGPSGGSVKWTAAVDRAYDRWLQVACRYLSVTAHLPAAGDTLDRDLERLRVEAKLADAGLRIRPFRRPPHSGDG